MAEALPFTPGGAEAELLVDDPDEARVYYEWLLRADGAAAVEDLSAAGVVDVRRPDAGAGERAGWIPRLVLGLGPEQEERIRTLGGAVRHAAVGDERRTYFHGPAGSWTSVVGAERRESPSRLSFDYSSLDIDAIVGFMSDVFGVAAFTVVDDEYGMRLLFDDGMSFAGFLQLHGVRGFANQSRWITYFEVDDVHLCVARAVESGSRLRLPPSRSPFNTFAILDDPWGNLYGLSQVFDRADFARVQVRDPGGRVAELRELFPEAWAEAPQA